MSRIIDEAILETIFSSHSVTEVYVRPDWRNDYIPKFYVIMSDSSSLGSLWMHLHNNCSQIYDVTMVPSPDSPLLEDKELLWFQGKWRDYYG